MYLCVMDKTPIDCCAGTKLMMLGTGSAFPVRSYNSCFAVRKGSSLLLVDTGGGNGILSVLGRAGIDGGDIHHLFITHVHTDHILGSVWVIRTVINRWKENLYEDKLNIYGNSDVLETIDALCRMTLLGSHYEIFKRITRFIDVSKDTRPKCGFNINFFDVGSQNVAQTGFVLAIHDEKRFVFLGDESLTERNAPYAESADYLMCGAFCRYADKDIFKPYEKHHHTVRDVAELAERCDVKNLILVHCEDNNLSSRAFLYEQEASECYSGRLIVPVDNQIIVL